MMHTELREASPAEIYASEAFPHYMGCALWCGVDSGDPDAVEPTYDIPDDMLALETRETMRAECEDFIVANWELIQQSGISAEQCGHDFWLTRNGHGAGFWDRGLGRIGDQLSAAAKVYKGADLYIGDDGLIYQS